jgi:hypothetical protein
MFKNLTPISRAALQLISVVVPVGVSALFAVAQPSAPVPWTCDGTQQTKTVSVAMGEGDSIGQLKEKAVAQMKREIIESCGGTVESQTQVLDSAVVEDSILWAARGQITSFEVIEGHVVSHLGDRGQQMSYSYQMTARVVAAKMAGNEDPVFHVNSVLMDKQAYVDGESARIKVRINQPAYVYIFNVASDHSISLLFPTRIDPTQANAVMPPEFVFPTDQHVSEGRKLRLAYDPSVESDHVTEYMEVLATKVPLDLGGSGIAEAINKPRNAGDTAASTALAKVLIKVKRDNVAFGVAKYELYRSSSPQQ